MSALEALKAVAAKLKKSTSEITSEVQKLRAAIAEKRRELHKATNAPPPPADIEERIKAAVQAAGSRWLRAEGTMFIKKLGDPAPVRSAGMLPWMANGSVPWAALCAGQPDQAVALLVGIARRVEYAPGPRLSERASVVDALHTELAMLEAQEEALVDQLADAGVVVEHRPEVVKRRQGEARQAQLEEERVADRRRRQEAVDEAHDLRPRASRSNYLAADDAKV